MALDEVIAPEEIQTLFEIFSGRSVPFTVAELLKSPIAYATDTVGEDY